MSQAAAPRFRPGHWLLAHWLAIANLLVALFVALPLVAPLLLAAGLDAPARWLYGAYHLVCHQWPGRSYFLFGAEPYYAPATLGVLAQASDFVGDTRLGWKVAWCERDLAIYGAVLLAGLLYAGVRRRARPLPWPWFALCLLPIALDGFSQLFGLRESTPLLRTLTGLLTGGAAVWLVYPRIERAVRDELPVTRAPAGAALASGRQG